MVGVIGRDEGRDISMQRDSLYGHGNIDLVLDNSVFECTMTLRAVVGGPGSCLSVTVLRINRSYQTSLRKHFGFAGKLKEPNVVAAVARKRGQSVRSKSRFFRYKATQQETPARPIGRYRANRLPQWLWRQHLAGGGASVAAGTAYAADATMLATGVDP